MPLREKLVLLLIHMLHNAIEFIEALERAGLEPSRAIVGFKDYAYEGKEQVMAYLRAKGYRLISAESIDMLEPEAVSGGVDAPAVVIEDGSKWARKILRHPELRERRVVVVEQTTRGITRLEEAARELGVSIPFSVISIPHWQLKSFVEPPMIGAAAVKGIQEVLKHVTLRYQPCAVLGLGPIGRAVVDALTSVCVRVRFYDPDPDRLLIAYSQLCGTPAGSAAEAVEGAHIIIGTSGQMSLNPELIRYLAKEVYLVSVSSDYEEFPLDFLRAASTCGPVPLRGSDVDGRLDGDEVIAMQYIVHGKRINVVEGGRPINFHWSNMSDQSADLVLAGMYLAALELAQGGLREENGILRDAMNQISARYRLAERYLKALGVIK